MANIIPILFGSFPNTLMSSLLIAVFLYWIISLFGIGFDDMNIDIEVATDTDIHIGANNDANADSPDTADIGTPGIKGLSIWAQFLAFMNVGKVPLSILISIWVFYLWAFCLFTTRLFTFTQSGLWSYLIFIPLSTLALIFTKITCFPIILFLNKTGFNGEEQVNYFGCTGIMQSTIEGNKIGIAIFEVNNDPVKLNVTSINGSEIKYSDKVILTEGPDKNQVYGVIKNW